MLKIPFRNLENYAVVTAMMGSNKYQLMIDTGTNYNLVKDSKRLLLDDNFSKKTMMVDKNGSLYKNLSVRPDIIKMGGHSFKNVDFLVENREFRFSDGIVGGDFLSNFTVNIDFKSSLMNLYTGAVNMATIRIILIDRIPIVECIIKDQKCLLILDTGFNSDILLYGDSKIIKRINKIKTNMVIDKNSIKRHYSYLIDERVINISGNIFDNVNIYYSEIVKNTIKGIEIDGVVGCGLFQKGELTIDYKNKRFGLKH